MVEFLVLKITISNVVTEKTETGPAVIMLVKDLQIQTKVYHSSDICEQTVLTNVK